MTTQPKPRAPSPAERAEATYIAFEAKVLILEQWARDGKPEHEDFHPKTHAELRAWTGPKFKDAAGLQPSDPLGTWSDPMIDRPKLDPTTNRPKGKYPDLILRFRAAIAGLQARLEGKAERFSTLKAASDILKKQVTNLAEQNDYLVGEIERLEFEFRTTKDLAKAHVRTIDAQALEIRELKEKIRDLYAILEHDALPRLEYGGDSR